MQQDIGLQVPLVELNDGNAIPQLGFGVFKIPADQTGDLVLQAIDAGYRHIDTAQMYGNERGVGEAVRDCGLPREDLFVTSKLNNGFHRPDDARREFEASLRRMGLDYLDLFLIHWPLPTRYGGDFVSTWRTLEAFKRDGRARSIGVSNFQPDHIRRLVEETDVVPAINQIEVHPYLANEDVRAFDADHGIVTQAWSPIAKGQILGDETLDAIGRNHGKSSVQVTLRWHLQRGDVIFPKTTKRRRMEENLDIFDFALSEEEMERITSLDRGEAGRTGPHPDVFAWIP
jgi:2,5-diketo-D-gluconate reductase A